MSVFKDAGHLFRFAGLFVLAFWCFWWCAATWSRRALGSMGTIAGAAIGEIAAHPVKFAGHQTCESCHTDIADTKKQRQACARELRGLPRARWPTTPTIRRQ